jgi:hypothetical protein
VTLLVTEVNNVAKIEMKKIKQRVDTLLATSKVQQVL